MGNETATGNEQLSRMALDALPAAVYTTDAAGRITYFNEAAVEMAGRRPEAGDEWCVTWRLYTPDGTPLPHDQCPMAVALRENRPVRGAEAVAERPDGSRVPFVPFPTPLRDESGALVGAVNMLVDVSKIKAAERQLSQRADEQAALYRFTDALYRAESLDHVYQAALDAIVAALGCERASILLFDNTEVMRFVAWRGLSDAYRDAVEGHSPWKPGDRDPAPIFVTDVAAAAALGELRKVVEDEAIGALAFIPVLANGRLIGKFMTYYPEPHDFSAGEIDLAVTIARQLGFSIERQRAEVAKRAADAQRTLLINELNHRVKNTLATVQAIASQTFAGSDTDPAAKEAFESRLIALSNAHSVLTEQSWESAEMHQIIAQAMRPHADTQRFGIEGPAIELTPRAAVAIAMSIHELATNAAKYGALSNGAGRVAISWRLGDEQAILNLEWKESGGPAVREPQRRGFGSKLIERSLSHDLDGAAKINYFADGVVCVITGKLQSIGTRASTH